MKFLSLFLAVLLAVSFVPAADATLVVNKYTNDFTLESPNNEQLKVCACGLKTDTLIIENVGSFYANYNVEIISPVSDWMTIPETTFSLPPKSGRELLVFVETPCEAVGTYDYTVRVTSSYGREEILQRTIRADKCQNIVLTVDPEKTVTNLCQPVDYNVTVKNVGTYGESYELSFGTYDEYMNATLKEFYLKPGQEYTQETTLTLPCTFYGEYDIPFLVYADKNRLEAKEEEPLTVENQFDHSINVDTQAQVCSRVTEYIPFTITNEIDVDNEYSIILRGPGFIDVENNERTIELAGEDSKTLLLEANAKEGQEGTYNLNIEVTDKFGKVSKERDVELDVKNCYDFELELRAGDEAIGDQTLCCGSYEYNLNVQNKGQTSETYNIDVQGPAWFVPEELTVSLDPGENKNVRLYAEIPCADQEYVIPVTVINNNHNSVNETVDFVINAQTERTCHAVAIHDDEHVITKDATVVPVVVKHEGIEGGLYDVTLESELYTVAQEQVELHPGESAVLHLETKNLTDMDFGRYISMPTLTYTTEDNPLAYVTEDIDYNEHVGTQLRDKSIFAKAWGWFMDNKCKPGLCGWTTILLLILILAAFILLLVATLAAKGDTLQALRVIFVIGIILVLVAIVTIQLPDKADRYEMPEDPEEYFVTIYENGRETINLDPYFTDADGDALSYVASQPTNIAAKIEGNELTLKPDLGFTGENDIVITADDGNGGFEDSPVLKIYVLPEKELSLLGAWMRYCLHINLWLLLLLLLLLLIATFRARQTDKKRRRAAVVAAKKTAPKKATRVVKKAAVVKKAPHRMTPAQKAAHRKLMDRTLVSSEPHEMRQVLKTLGKRGTNKNVKVLQAELKKFKANKKYKNNREEFYRYLKEERVLFRLENAGKKPAAKKVARKTPVKKASVRKTAPKKAAVRKAAPKKAVKKAVRKTARKKAAKKVVRKAPKNAPRKMSAATKAKISRTLDAKLVSSEEHEMKQVLETFNKRQTNANVETLRAALKSFKADGRYKPKNRQKFYQYLESNNVHAKLEGKGMPKAQREAISRALDQKLVSHQPHELRQVLTTHGKATTARNMDLLANALTDFQRGNYKPKNRERFYRYLKEKNVLGKLRNK